jgi:hypothetical protein
MGAYEELFKFAAKAGSLEGYLYEREKVEPLDDWVNNIEKMYTSLPDPVQEDVRDEFRNVLNRNLTYGEDVLEDDIRTRLSNLLSEL